MKTLSALFTLSQTSNKITNSIEQRAGGEQIIRPVNLNGSYNARGNINLSLPVGKERAGKFDVSTNINYSRDANLINTIKNFTSHMTVIQEFGLTQPFGETIEVGLNASLSYNLVHYSFQKFLNNSYYTYNYSFDFSFTSPAGFIFSTDAAYTAYKGRSVDFNQEYILWNASIAMQIFKNKRGEVRLSINDILNQNINVSRSASNNFIEDVQTLTLKRFGLLTFTYNLFRMEGGKMQEPE
jgi:hypothetical protein